MLLTVIGLLGMGLSQQSSSASRDRGILTLWPVAAPCGGLGLRPTGEQVCVVQEASAKVSAALTGRPKTQEHKDAIAASQRRRLAATSILRAVEDVHSQQHASSPGSGAGYAPVSELYAMPCPISQASSDSVWPAALAPVHAPMDLCDRSPAGAGCCRLVAVEAITWRPSLCRHMRRITPCPCRRRMSGGGASSSGRQLQSTVLGSYKAELREFRALQEELQPWTDAFKEQHQRKPTLADVQATREAPSASINGLLLLPSLPQ